MHHIDYTTLNMLKGRRRKLHYVPGLFSALMCPLLFIGFAKPELERINLRSLTVFLMDTSSLKIRYDKLGMFVPDYNLPKRNYIKIKLDGDNLQDKIKLDFARVRIKEINSLGDTLNGVHFSFGDSCQYWTYVKAIDILQSCNARYWLPVNDDIWYYHRPFRSSGSDMVINYIYEELTWSEKAKTYIFNIWGSSWHIIVGYTGFLLAIFYFKSRLNSS